MVAAKATTTNNTGIMMTIRGLFFESCEPDDMSTCLDSGYALNVISDSEQPDTTGNSE